MTTNTKPMAKALHTITVLVRVAGNIMQEEGSTADLAMQKAVRILGYDGTPDPLNLAGKALAQLKADR